jgi:tetratricopeptide (TPR) repeat protein
MRYFLTCLSGVLLCIFVQAGPVADSLLIALNRTIQASPTYDAEKNRAIGVLRQNFYREEQYGTPLKSRFDLCLSLYEEYKVFNYDSAFTYAKKLEGLAFLLRDPNLIAYAKLKLSFTLLSSGLFKETLDSLKGISLNNATDSLKAEYYSLMGRFNYDLGDFDNDRYHTPAYILAGNGYMDSALRLYPSNSFQHSYFNGLKDIKSGNMDKALANFLRITDRPDLTDHQLAVALSTLSDIYIQKGEPDKSINLLIRAAMADIRSSTKETAAIFNLAGILFKKGDVKDASLYIERALSEAVFYGARQRKVQVSVILPLIEGEKLNRVESQKKTLITYSVIATFLLLLVIILAIVIFRQVNKLKIAKKIITAAHLHQQEINYKLMEADKIKEEYIGYFFNTNSEFFAKIEKFKRSVEQKINERKIDEIRFLVNNINLKTEKEELIKNFDKAFLKLFPHFVIDFNALFKEEEQIKLKEGELLNTDLRIFALIRMGIHDNERIARILEYSVNTIYTYKTKIRNKSIVPNEEFEARIMDIKTV